MWSSNVCDVRLPDLIRTYNQTAAPLAIIRPPLTMPRLSTFNSDVLTGAIMPRVCHFTGKRTTSGRQYTHRGKAKYLGGVGTKVTGKTLRKFKPNIQRVRAVINGKIVRIKVSTKAIRMGLVVKPMKRNYKKDEAAA